MSSSTISLLHVYRDLALSMLNAFCGRLYPTLRPPPADLTGKTAIITGANSGVGFQIALELARQNATVYLACRNVSKAQEAISQITSLVPDSIDRVNFLILDTSSLPSVRHCAEEWKKSKNPDSVIHLLYHNAGIPSNPNQPFTPDNLPTTYATNLLGSFLLTHLLEPSLSPTARIIFTSSMSNYISSFTPTFSLDFVPNQHSPGFHAPAADVTAVDGPDDVVLYGHTKAMQLVFAKLLQRRWDAVAKVSRSENRRIAQAFSPGFTSTPALPGLKDLRVEGKLPFRVLALLPGLGTDVAQGAATGVWLATTRDEAVAMGGGYWENMTRRATTVDRMSMEMLERFWIRWEADARISWR